MASVYVGFEVRAPVLVLGMQSVNQRPRSGARTRGPKSNGITRISHSGSRAQYTGDARNPGV